LDAERLDAKYLAELPYDEREWKENLLRPNSAATTTQRQEFLKNVGDPWLVKFHQQEAKAGIPSLHFQNLTVASEITKLDPALREIHKAAAKILKEWQAQDQKAAA